MQPLKIVLTGASGMLGADLLARWQAEECHALGRSKPVSLSASCWHPVDLTDPEAVAKEIHRLNPDVVVHSAAMSDVDACERDPDAAFRANGLTAHNVALACQRFDTPLVAISTDYVFDGQNPAPDGYREYDPTHPISVYGRSKWWGEECVRQLLRRYWIVRTSWLFGPGRPSFIDKILTAAASGTPVPCVRDMVSCPTSTSDLAGALDRMIRGERFGTYHVTNGGFCSRVELAEFVLNQIDASTRWIRPLLQSELKLPAQRPAFSAMKNWMWETTEHPLRHWKQAVSEYVGSRSHVK